jgi:hypothetical protein
MLEEENKNDIMFYTDSNPFNVSFPEWTVRWWRWLRSIRHNKSPALDLTGYFCSESQYDPNVWFLAGTSAPVKTAKRKCIIPHGKAIFFPIITSIFSFPADSWLKSEEEVMTEVIRDIDTVKPMRLTIDGINIKKLTRFRVRSDPFEDIIGGLKTNTVSDGYWIFLKPPNIGRHSIHFKAKNIDFFNEVTYDISINSNQ